MSRKVFYSLLVCINLFFLSSALADQGAITMDGRKVVLRSNGTWSYESQVSGESEIREVNRELKDSLRPYIGNRHSVFKVKFDMMVNLNNTNYEYKYKLIMHGFYKAYKNMTKKSFNEAVEKEFTKSTANNIKTVMQHWDSWKQYCQ
ncbi:MAG: hypothetical protein GY853_12390 [PVC group bacterium]|nr:hypothetical protein [PVC group bacterium]